MKVLFPQVRPATAIASTTVHRPALTALTGIRFFAAIHVVFFHYSPKLPGITGTIVQNGYQAVGLFFILSGFVLAYNYADRPLEARRFWASRFARIYPAYLLGFLLIAPAVVVRLHADPGKLAAAGLAAATLMQGWIPGFALLWNAPGWSLSCEAFFYLVFPVVLPLLSGLSIRGLWAACGVCCLAAATPPLIYAGEDMQFFPLLRLAEFVLGIAMGLLFTRGERAPWLGGLLAGAVAGFSLTPIFAMFVFWLAGHRGWFLSSRTFIALGDASYATYILQSPLMAYFLLATRGMSAAGWRRPLDWLEFCCYCALLIVASLACYRWVESPARRWLLGKI